MMAKKINKNINKGITERAFKQKYEMLPPPKREMAYMKRLFGDFIPNKEGTRIRDTI